MFGKRIKNGLLILIALFFVMGVSFAADKKNVTEKTLIHDVKVAKTKNKKEKALKNLFYYYVDLNRYDDIINISNDVLKYKLTKKEKFTVYYNLAIAYKHNKKLESSIEAAQETEYLYPKKIDVQMLMGEIYKDNSLYELAITKFKNVLNLDGKHVTASINLGDIYIIQEKYKQALEYYKKAISLRENLPTTVYINAAICYKETGDRDSAIKVLKSIKNHNKVSVILLADIYQTKKDYAKAKEVLAPYVYGKKIDLEIYCKLAEVNIISKDYAEAEKLLLFYKNKAKKKNVEIIDFLLAETYYMSGKKEKAVKIFKDILKYTKSEYFKDIVNKFLKIGENMRTTRTTGERVNG